MKTLIITLLSIASFTKLLAQDLVPVLLIYDNPAMFHVCDSDTASNRAYCYISKVELSSIKHGRIVSSTDTVTVEYKLGIGCLSATSEYNNMSLRRRFVIVSYSYYIDHQSLTNVEIARIFGLSERYAEDQGRLYYEVYDLQTNMTLSSFLKTFSVTDYQVLTHD